MKLYSLTDKKLNLISSETFKLEREIQEIVEENLSILFNLELVKSEFRIKNFRIDSLGFDRENKSFVIVEYKKDKNFSVIDQGYTYLSLMLNNKSDFILEYNENCDDNLRRGDIDWSQSRVIFIPPQFTDYQKNSVNFKDVPFELWEIKRYQNGLVGFDQQKTTSEESISTVQPDSNNVVSKVSQEIKKYDEEYLLDKTKERTPEFKEFYYQLRNRVLELGEVEIKVNGKYISFQKDNKSFVDFILYRNSIGVTLNLKKGELNDVLNKTEDQSERQHWGSGDYIVWIKQDEDLEYVMSLIKQSYNKGAG
jgi:predicted transport protein